MRGRRPRATGTVGQGRPPGIHSLVRVAFLAVASLLTGCAGEDLPQDTLAPAGPVAQAQDELWNIVFWVALAVFVIVETLLIAVLVRFRARPGDDSIPKQTHGNTRLEVIWTIIPALILAVIAVPTVQLIFELSQPPEDALEVRVIGKQYWWEFEYLGDEGKGVITANELVVPVGRPVRLTLESTGQATSDPLGVIHSFWVPKLAGKQDVVPGHQRHLSFTAEEEGTTYSGQCAEFCGLSHANMRLAVLAVSEADFEEYLDSHSTASEPPSSGDEARGAQLFEERQCVGCHAVSGFEGAEARIGPNLTFFAEREKFAGYMLDNDINDSADNVRAWLKNPPQVKPGSQMPNLGLSDQDINDLIIYLRTLQ
ncbi:MAG: cytochrome c oxidase subunit II [Nitriliruptorales bacterium]|nr:cytochrome c oxidase subunit II [Nitriliruptorales bacterium]